MTDRLAEATSGKAQVGGRIGGWIGGRARRREYWAWMAPIVVLEVLLAGFGTPILLLASLARTLLWIRRLHDLGVTGWVVVIFNIGTNVLSFALLTVAGAQNASLFTSLAVFLVIVVMGVIPGQPGRNRFGPPPGRKPDVAEAFS